MSERVPRFDAMKRLGVPMVACPNCGTMFRALRFPRHWIHAYFDGEIIEHDDNTDDLCCSEACGTARADRLNERQEEPDTLASLLRFSYYREEPREPQP